VADLVTGEAVVLELQAAKLPSRVLAISIDLVIEYLLFLMFGILAAPVMTDSALAAGLLLVGVIGALAGYPVLFETLSRGRSLGKMALGLRVVRDDGGPIRFRHALTRVLAGIFVDFWVTLGAGAVISSLASSKGKRIGDMLAGTMVIRERLPLRPDVVPPMPPYLAPWAADLDLSGLPNDLLLAVRQYLSRARELNAAVGEAMAVRLAADVVWCLGRPAPSGTPPWDILAAVAAERRNREMAQLMNQYWNPAAYTRGMPASVPRLPGAYPQAPYAAAPHHPGTPPEGNPAQDAPRPAAGDSGSFVPPT
jgi:uncharacterized RDD family membrane protein YckC